MADDSRMVDTLETVTINKLAGWENLLFALALLAMLLPTGAENGISGLLLIWFVSKRAWRNLPFSLQGELPVRRPLWTTLALIRAQVPGFYPLLLGIVGCAAFTALAYLVGCVSGVIAVDFGKGLTDTIRLIGKQGIYGSVMVVVFLAARQRGWRLSESLPIFTGMLAVYVVYMLVQRYSGIDWVHGLSAVLPPNRFAYGVYRGSGFMGHPLTLAYNAMLTALFCAGMWLASSRQAELGARRLWGVCFVLSVAILFLSGSRWPLAVTVITVIGVGLPSLKKAWRWAIPAGLCLVAALWVEGSTVGRMRELLGSPATIEARIPRLVFWKVHWAMFADHPVTGVGYPARETVAVDYYDKSGYTEMETKYSAHNIYLQTLADSGLIGFAGLLSLMAGTVFAARELARRRGNPGLVAVVVATLLAGLMQNTLRDSEFAFCLWACFAVYLSQLAFEPLAAPQIKRE